MDLSNNNNNNHYITTTREIEKKTQSIIQLSGWLAGWLAGYLQQLINNKGEGRISEYESKTKVNNNSENNSGKNVSKKIFRFYFWVSPRKKNIWKICFFCFVYGMWIQHMVWIHMCHLNPMYFIELVDIFIISIISFHFVFFLMNKILNFKIKPNTNTCM